MTQKRLPTAAQLKEMAQIDIHTVEKESLVSAEDVQIHTELSDRTATGRTDCRLHQAD